MIIQFESYPDDECELWKLYAILDESGPVEIGIFEKHELDAACDRFAKEYRRLHLH